MLLALVIMLQTMQADEEEMKVDASRKTSMLTMDQPGVGGPSTSATDAGREVTTDSSDRSSELGFFTRSPKLC